MTPLRISSLSTEPIRVPVFACANGVAVDLRSLPVAMALTLPGEKPVPGDWTSGIWDTPSGGPSKAEVIISTLSAGTYDVWLMINNSVVKKVGVLVVY